MAILRRILLIVNLRSVIVTVLAVASTYACGRIGLHTDLPIGIIATAVVFPIVFSIGGAFKRREAALDEYGSIKAHARALFLASRDWLEKSDPEVLAASRRRVSEFMTALRTMLMMPPSALAANEREVYRTFSEWSGLIKSLRARGLASGEVSRCNQYLSKVMHSFERLKHIYQYRTPVTLRAFAGLFLIALPVLCGPYFIHLAEGVPSGWTYLMAVVTSLVLVSLDNIQDQLENPFDQVGEDDVVINVEKFVETLEG
jgi:predicted membrane chloride channel (bestrophin family)